MEPAKCDHDTFLSQRKDLVQDGRGGGDGGDDGRDCGRDCDYVPQIRRRV